MFVRFLFFLGNLTSFAAALVVVFALWLCLKPIERVEVLPKPARTVEEALARFEAMKSGEDKGLDSLSKRVNPICEAKLYFRGERATNVAVLLHGITSCPRQFDSLSKRLFERGYAVVAPRFAYHGLQDRLTTAQERLTAEDIASAANEAIDIARGLGDSVTVVGLSMGGVAAALAAQTRSDVSKVVIIAPIFVSKLLPANDLLQKASANLLLTLPNQFVWWNDIERENLKGPKATYPRFSSKAMGETLKLGVAVMEQAKSSPPKAGEVVMILNENDAAINNEACRELAKRWKDNGCRSVTVFEFPASDSLGHDWIDPEQPNQRIERAYPRLLELIAR